MKICARCKEEKPTESFRVKRKETGELQPYCIPCNREYQREHYQANKAAYVAKARRTTKKCADRNASRLLEYFQEHPCVDCGTEDPRVLEFDHIRDKKRNISQMLSNVASWNSILEEIEKCEVRCRNCHAIVTYERAGNRRSLWT